MFVCCPPPAIPQQHMSHVSAPDKLSGRLLFVRSSTTAAGGSSTSLPSLSRMAQGVEVGETATLHAL